MNVCERVNLQNKMDNDVKIKLYYMLLSVLVLPLLAWNLGDCGGRISTKWFFFLLGLMHPCYHTHIREMNINCGLIHSKYYTVSTNFTQGSVFLNVNNKYYKFLILCDYCSRCWWKSIDGVNLCLRRWRFMYLYLIYSSVRKR